MARQIINLGSAPDGAGGDDVRGAFTKTNANFEELYTEVPQEEAQAGTSSTIRGWTTRRVFDAIKSWANSNLGSAARADKGFGEGQVLYGSQTNIPTLGWHNGWFITKDKVISGVPEWRTVISLPYGLENGKYTGTFISQNLGSGEAMLHCVRHNELLPSRTVMDSLNTTVASSGAIHSASPIVKLFNNKHEIENESEFGLTPTVTKLSTGVYEITNTLGLRSDSWFLDTPQDRNGNKYFNVDYEEVVGTKVDGVLDLGELDSKEEYESKIKELQPTTTIIKCFERVWNPKTGIFENGNPVDIKEGRYITLRFNEVQYTIKPKQEENE